MGLPLHGGWRAAPLAHDLPLQLDHDGPAYAVRSILHVTIS
jgi:hypothetical protein